jgi:hypothetical protein
VAQAEADGQAIARRSGHSRLRRLLQSRGGLRSRLEAAGQQEQKTCGRGAFVPLAFFASEAFQFDWSEDWAIIGGVPGRGIYGNMRTAVDKVGRGKERQVNPRFSAMVSHFLFEADFCNPASGWEKERRSHRA